MAGSAINLPEGFVLDQPQQPQIYNGLPAGFVIDQPAEPYEEGHPGNAMSQGIPFGDEIAAGAAALIGKVMPESMGGFPSGTSVSDAYSHMHSDINRHTDAYKERNPKKSAALGIGTGVATLGLGGLKVLDGVTKGASLGQKIGMASGIGAAEGGLYAAGEADPGSRLKGGLQGATVGAVMGPVGLGLSQAAGGVIRSAGKAGKHAKEMLSPASAEHQVRKALMNDSIDDIAATLDELGPNAIVADAGPNSRALLDTAAGFQGSAKRQINDFLDVRQAGRNDRVTGSVYNELGNADDFLSDIDQIIAQRAADATPLYQKAYQTPIQIDEQIQGILATPSGKKAMAKAMRLASDDGIRIPDLEEGLLPTQLVDYVQRALRDVADSASRTGKGNESRILGNLGNRLKAAADKQNPDFAKARNAFAGPSQLIDAAESGQKFLSQDSFFSVKALKSMTDSEKEFYAKGAAKAIRDKILSAQDGADAYKRVFGNALIRERIKAVMPDDGAYQRFAKSMKQESAMSATRARVQGNSLTAERQIAAEDFNNAREAGQAAARGDLVGVAISGIREALKRKNVGNAQRAEEIANILLGSDPQAIKAIMKLQAGMRGKNAQVLADAFALSMSNKAATLTQE